MDLIAFTCPTNPALAGMAGVANGYVAVPPYHPIYRMEYDSIHRHFDIDIHGGLTYCGPAGHLYEPSVKVPDNWWVVGFDTQHGSDFTGFMPGIERYVESMRGPEASRWQDIREVELEALKLKWQLEEIDTNWNRVKFGWERSGVRKKVSKSLELVKDFLKLS